jgi:cellulose synthase/poly-beta-1,6-N-acetylglucosamine synthase-like glycosyltransferase
MSSPNGSDNHKNSKIAKLSLSKNNDRIVDPAMLKFFASLGIADKFIDQAYLLAAKNGTNIETELIANRIVSENEYYRSMAKRLGVAHLQNILPSSIITSPSIDVLLTRKGPLRIQLGDRILTVLNPALSAFLKLEELLQSKPDLKESFAIASSVTIRESVWRVNERERVEAVVRELHDTKPNMSAKALLTNWQSFFLGFLLFGVCLLIHFQPNTIIIALHASFSLFYLSFNLLKLSAGFFFYTEADPDSLPSRCESLPKYTILIALYKEVQVAQQLIKAMSRLRWPKSKLDIKLICEDEDISTINALINADPGPQFEIIRVPHLQPKTKPKALQYAMIAAKGEYVAVYDAEDRPHPDQLLEAYREFERHGEYLACLQAPLVMTNADCGWLPGLFSLEYSSLFRRLIPLLSHFGLPIPLGGTSNHFRKSALLEVGGWDPCNVTEDVDLGIRLYKQGYYTGLLKRPTLETAPTKINVWIKQRTRWLKGWMQTWLVFMRHPLQQLANGGIFSFIIMQILIGGLLIASLAHPFVILFIALTIKAILSNAFFEASTLEICLFYLDIFNLIAGYLIFVRVGMSSLISAQRKKIKKRWLFFTPLYWLLISIAGWRALSQLPLRSQFWEKTPHEPARREI